MVTLMQCIHDTVYTLGHTCYATLSLSQFFQLKKNIKNEKKKLIYRFDRKKTDFRFGLHSKKYMI